MKKIIYLLPLLLCFQIQEKEYMPKMGMGEIFLDHKYFKVNYDCKHKIPNWVYYTLTKNQVQTENAKRRNNFHDDPILKYCNPTKDDYTNSNFDRGHICPGEDMDHDQQAMDETFVMTNMAPQYPKFNRGIWKNLEAFVRQTAVDENQIYIVKGVIVGNNPQKIGSGVSIPKYCYATFINKSLTKSWAYLLENKESKEPLSKFKISIDSLEKVTKIDFFYGLPDEKENKLEK